MPALEARHPDFQSQIHSRIFARDLPFSAVQVTWMGQESVFVGHGDGGLSAGSEPSEEYLASKAHFGLTNRLSRKKCRVPGFPHCNGDHVQNRNERNTKC